MKKLFRIALFVLATIAAVGCTNDMDQIIAPEQDMVTVYFTTGKDATRTTLDKNLNVLWSDSDQLRIEYNDGDGNYGIAPAATIVENNGTDATFAINLPAGFEDKAVYAAYPYWAVGWGGYNNQLYGVPIADVQPMVNGGFGDNVNTSVFKLNWDGTGYTGRMVNVGGIIAVKVTGDVNITKAVLASKDGKVMAGTGTAYNISESGCSWDGHYTASNPKEITLNAATALNCAEGVELMFVACANDFSGGFTLTVTSDTNKTVQYDLAGGELARARILDLAPVALDANDYTGNVINLRGTYKTKKIASKWNRADAEKAMANTIMTAEDAGFQPEAAPKLGQKYGVIYEDNGWNNMVLYFDVATEPNAEGMYDLINLQDRASSATGGAGYDEITHNASYYDPTTGNIYFDFIRKGYYAPGVGSNALENEGDEAGYGYSWVFYTGTLPSHAIVGEYTIAEGTASVSAARPGHQMNTAIHDANTLASFGSPKDGQEFCVNYNSGWGDGLLYFDIAAEANVDGTYNLINLIDRAPGYDQIPYNASWYNPTTGQVHFEFIILSWSAPGGGQGNPLQNEGDVAGYLYCYDYTPAE